jgi:hypothetical protein
MEGGEDCTFYRKPHTIGVRNRRELAKSSHEDRSLLSPLGAWEVSEGHNLDGRAPEGLRQAGHALALGADPCARGRFQTLDRHQEIDHRNFERSEQLNHVSSFEPCVEVARHLRKVELDSIETTGFRGSDIDG